MKGFWKNWRTTSMALCILIIWGTKIGLKVEIPTEVATAISVILSAIGLVFAEDAKGMS